MSPFLFLFLSFALSPRYFSLFGCNKTTTKNQKSRRLHRPRQSCGFFAAGAVRLSDWHEPNLAKPDPDQKEDQRTPWTGRSDGTCAVGVIAHGTAFLQLLRLRWARCVIHRGITNGLIL